MKKIGFVDYYISEWHANNYPAWIAAASEAMGEDFAVAYAWAEEDLSPVYNETTDEWCEKFGVERCETVDELCERSDYIVILSPSDPDKHLGYAEKVLKHGKRTYIDKTFAPDTATAEKIYALADKYGAKIFSSSALRYATELEGLCPEEELSVTGGGRSIEEYIVHQAEMVIKLIGADVKTVSVTQVDDAYEISASFVGGKRAKMSYAPKNPFGISVDGGEYIKITSDFFPSLMSDMLRFFIMGVPSFDREETIRVMKLRDAILCAVEELK